MSAVLVQNGTAQVWPVAERTFCTEAFAFVAAKRGDSGSTAVDPTTRVTKTDSSKHTPNESQQSRKKSPRKGGVWFTHQKSTLLWYPYAVEWICAPGSVDKRFSFPTKSKIGAGLGLRNRRNACFLNATIQALTYLPPFYCSALKNRHARHCVRKQRNLYCGYCDFEQHIRTVVTPRGVVSKALRLDAADIKFYPRLHSEMLHRFDISTRRQACAYEALTMVLEWLRKYDLPPELQTKFLKHSIPFPQLNTAYLGQVVGSVIEHRRTCLNCHDETIVHEIVNDYVLSLNGSKTLDHALRRHFAPEDLDAANKSDCDRCKSKQQKRLEKRIIVPPNVLILVVKRSLWTPRDSLISGFHGLTKDNRTLQVPKILDLSQLMTFSSAEGSSSSETPRDEVCHEEGSYTQIEHKYQITSAVVHHGVPMAGHYVAICQSPSGVYFKYNDEHVSPVPEDKLAKELSKAYIYFYTRVSGGTPLPSKDQVTTNTDGALARLLSHDADSGKKRLSLLVSISSSPIPLSSTSSSSFSRIYKQHSAGTPPTLPMLSETSPLSLPNIVERDVNMLSEDDDSGDELIVEVEDASTTTSSFVGASPTGASQYSSASIGEEDEQSSPSTVTHTPRLVSSHGSPRHKKVRSLRKNVAKFFRVSSSSDTFEKEHKKENKEPARESDLRIPLLSTTETDQWETEALEDTGADLKKFQQLAAKDSTSRSKFIPGNKRQQHDLEYDRGRSKKKKRLIHDQISLPTSATFDRIQRGEAV